jgi:hypothetical protein
MLIGLEQHLGRAEKEVWRSECLGDFEEALKGFREASEGFSASPGGIFGKP